MGILHKLERGVGDPKAAPPAASAAVAGVGDPTAQPDGLRLIDIIDRLYDGREIFFHCIRTAADVMTREIKCLTLDDKLGDALRLFKESRVRHALVVEDVEPPKGEDAPLRRILIGVVSQRDVARILSPGAGTLVQADSDDAVLKQPLGQLVTRNPVTIEPGTAFLPVVKLLVDHKIDCLPVTVGPEKEKEPVGILTSHDVIKCFVRMETLRRMRDTKPRGVRLIDLMRGGQPNQPTELLLESVMGRVGDLMQTDVVTLTIASTICDAVGKMQEHRIRHLPVLDEQGKVKGILSDRDILAYLPPKSPGKEQAGGKFRESLLRIDAEDEETAKALAERVSVVMTGSPTVVNPDTPLLQVASLLADRRFGSVPAVAASNGGVVGILTTTDLLNALLALGRIACPAAATTTE